MAYGKNDNGSIVLKDKGGLVEESYNDVYCILFVRIDDYNRITKQNIVLNNNEAIVYCDRAQTYQLDNMIKFDGFKEYKTVKNSFEFNEAYFDLNTLYGSICVIVNDFDQVCDNLFTVQDIEGINLSYFVLFDTKENTIEKEYFVNRFYPEVLESNTTGMYSLIDVEDAKADFVGSFGGLFFIGIILSIVFIFTTILIVYYKQITEGYEDKKNYEIMKSVGMKTKDVKKTVSTQMAVMSYAPLTLAIIHLVFAFPLISYLLSAFGLIDKKPFIIASIISVSVYAIAYVLVISITSNSYLSIINNEDE